MATLNVGTADVQCTCTCRKVHSVQVDLSRFVTTIDLSERHTVLLFPSILKPAWYMY